MMMGCCFSAKVKAESPTHNGTILILFFNFFTCYLSSILIVWISVLNDLIYYVPCYIIKEIKIVVGFSNEYYVI